MRKADSEQKMTGMSKILLIPVDFSDMSLVACRAGFEFAVRLDLHPHLLHASPSPFFAGVQPEPTADPAADDLEVEELSDEVVVDKTLHKEAIRRSEKFRKKIVGLQQEGKLPDIPFSISVREGVPEEVILDYARQTPPGLIVMANRGKRKRELDMIGSVTAEVMDSCRVPLFTVPENYTFCGVENIVRLAFFCNVDDNDLLTVDALMQMFGHPKVQVWLIPVNDRAGHDVKLRMEAMRSFLDRTYPESVFHVSVLPQKDLRSRFESLVSEHDLQLTIVPNKKKNILSRLFNPGIAHKLLFERDMPMLVLPV